MTTYFKQILCVLFVFSNCSVFSQFGTSCASATTVNINICNGLTIGTVPITGVTTTAPPTSSLCANTTTNAIRVGAEGWISFTTDPSGANISHTITLTTPTGQNLNRKNLAFELYKGPCPGTYVTCQNSGISNPEVMNVSLQPNTTYYIRAVNIATSTVNTGAANVQAIPNVTVSINGDIVNDEVTGAIPLTVNTSTCVLKKIDLCKATSSACAPTPACGNYVPTPGGNSKDLWYKVVVPASGNFFIETQAVTGTGAMTNAALAVYSSTLCGSASILGCSDSNPAGLIDPGTSLPYTAAPMSMPSLYITGATPTSTVYIRIWNENGYAAGLFNICVNDMGPCGNLATNNFCSNPAPIIFAGATATSVATNTVTGINYTLDSPGDLSVAVDAPGFQCVYEGNNSWYSFIATQDNFDNGLDLPFELDDDNCYIEAAIYNITTTNGCCKNFTQLDNCDGVSADYNPTLTYSLTVPSNILIAGNTYYLMINNSSPTACSFSITGWSATGVLPVDFISFTGENNGAENILKWIVTDDNNVKSYTLESSTDAVNFTEEETIEAKKLIYSANTEYKVTDKNPRLDLTYYRVRLNTENEEKKYSNTISVYLRDKYENIYNLHPNPTTADLNFEYYSQTTNRELYIQLIGASGNLILDLKQTVGEGKNNITLPMSELDRGVYILKVVSESSGKTTHHKVIKN